MAPRRVSIGSTETTLEHRSLEGERAREEGGSGVATSTDAARFDSPGFRRFLLVSVIAALAFLPLATAAIGLLVDPDEVTAWLEPRLSAALNRSVTVGDAGLALLPRPGLHLSDVRVAGGGSELPAVAAVRDVHLEAALLPLVTGRVAIRRVRLSGVDVHLEVDASGVSNFGDLVPESRVVETARVGPVGFAVDQVSVDDASFSYFDGVGDRSFAVSGASMSLGLGLEPDGRWTAAVDAVADSLLLRAPKLSREIVRTQAPSFSATVLGDGALDRLEIDGGSLRHHGQELTVAGSVEGISASDPELDLRLTNPALQLGVLTSFLPQAARARSQPALQGTADVRLGLRGSLRDPDGPALLGVLGLADAGLLMAGQPWVTDVDGDVRIRTGTVVLDSMTGSFADGPFALSATLDRSDRRVEGTIKAAPEVDGFEGMGLTPFGFSLTGGAELAFDFAGPLSRPDSIRLRGSALLTGVQAEHPEIGVPVYLASASFRVDGERLEWNDLTVLVGTDPLVTTGSLDGIMAASWRDDAIPVLDAAVSGGSLDLEALFPSAEPRPDVTYARLAFAHLGGRAVDGVEARQVVEALELSRPRSLPVHGVVAVTVDTLDYGLYALEDVRATLALSDSILTARDVELSTWEGRVTGTLNLGVGGRVDEPFSLVLRAEGVDATRFLAQLSPMGEAVSGTLDLEVDVEGTTDRALMPVLAALDGSIQITVTDGTVGGTGINLALADFLAEERWRDLDFSEWRTDISVEDEMLRIVESELRGDDAAATLTGAVGLGGAVDLAMALSIPPDRLEAVSLRRTGVAQSVLDRLTESGSALDLGIRISGTLQGPTLEPDALAASEGAGRASAAATPSEARE